MTPQKNTEVAVPVTMPSSVMTPLQAVMAVTTPIQLVTSATPPIKAVIPPTLTTSPTTEITATNQTDPEEFNTKV